MNSSPRIPTVDAPATTSPAPASAKQRAARILPRPVVEALDSAVFRLRRARIRAIQRLFGRLGFNIVKKDDYYSTLPVLAEIEQTRARWDRPSALVGIDLDVPAMTSTLRELAGRWDAEFVAATGDYLANTRQGFGPGYPHLDARTLYFMLREHKPARYLEIGSGLSTYYASLAAARNAADGSLLQITCVEPYPFDALRTLDNFELVEGFVQDVPLSTFEALEAGDVLFIDSSHALKIDSDVAFLFLEVLPRLKPGVIVHIHDVHFPFNGPYPADTWLFGERWPVYWNEAMVVQIFLAHSSAYRVLLSTPMIRHTDESVLTGLFADYVPVADDPNPPSSLWLRRV
ncbi:class I SAM-dependent methyltransferase [Aeromicrobium endophyticum]|uniref:Class I SAM-dependent methyltransferase n=1 Tax=Aeromicrobium endophyticum TaxID=2292704 RepID=A0A371PCV0_9ACTN|nr:class I SAM-dependent methyltransferase [Aeromicrobium endophyticum]REK73426.1 class I SAM-dependent methyltransferase [Aeromicrobium endophyticum]